MLSSASGNNGSLNLVSTKHGHKDRIDVLHNTADGTSPAIALNNERFSKVRAGADLKQQVGVRDGAVPSEEMLVCPLSIGEWADFCCDKNDSWDNVMLKGQGFAVKLNLKFLVKPDGTEVPDFLRAGMQSVRPHFLQNEATGLFIIDVKTEYVGLLRTHLTFAEGMVALSEEKGSPYLAILPKHCNMRDELEGLWQVLPDHALVSLIVGNKSVMDKNDVGFGIAAEGPWALELAQREQAHKWKTGNVCIVSATGF